MYQNVPNSTPLNRLEKATIVLVFFRAFLKRVLLFLPSVLLGGQSLVLSSGTSISVTDPVLPANQSWRLEFQLHNFTHPGAGVYNASVFQLLGTGSTVRLYPDGTVETEASDGFAKQQPCFVSTTGLTNVLIRLQRDVAARRFSCELWSYDGTNYRSQTDTITEFKTRPSAGGTIGGGATTALGFLRVSNSLVPLGSRPPVTADPGDWTELKFDGNLRDSSGKNHNASGAASYMPTPDQIPVANPKTFGAPAWTTWTSLRAGFPAQLDGSASYSLADETPAVSYQWQQLSGPSTVSWTNQNSATPTMEGLVFGTYSFSLQVRDAAGRIAQKQIEVGAVATDDNGVVINADPNVDRIFGPMIAFGKNPWGYADERAMSATRLRAASYKQFGLDHPLWENAGPGTVTYTFNGKGGYAAGPGSTLTRAVDANGTTLVVANAANLDLSSLPTRLLIGEGAREEIRICTASAQTGAATLGICYDGRGQASNADGYRSAAKAWPAGTTVGQMKVTGSGTAFLSSLCTAGPGPTGDAVYSAGTARLTPNSTDVTGVGTVWSTANKVIGGYALRVSATHGGAPFVFTAYISSAADATHLKLARPYPADADAGTFSYAVVSTDTRHLSLHYTRPADGSDGQTYFQTTGCESDTDAYLYGGHDIASLNATVQKNVRYANLEGFGFAGAFGANFYGEDLAHRALYYRSGWTPALQTARTMSDIFVTSPFVAGGDIGGIPLLLGGGVVGGFAAAVLDTDDPNRPKWSDLRGLARQGRIGNLGCNDADSRDSGYLAAWLTLAAAFDPDSTQRAEWRDQLGKVFGRDQRCKGTDNSWAHGFLWNGAGTRLKVTPGSAIATGTNIPQGTCFGIASGVMSVRHNSATGLGAGFVAGRKIAVTGTLDGKPFTGFYEFSVKPDGSILMSALWPGDSGQVTWMIENNDWMTTIGTSNNDPMLKKNWACQWNSATQITLNRPWDGPAASNAVPYSYVLAGLGQQPYMLSIKITQMLLASQIADNPVAPGYAELAGLAAKWVHDVGYDPVTQGMFYGRLMEACEPVTTPPPGSAFASRTPGCNNGLDPGAIRAARVLTAEASPSLRVYFESTHTQEAKDWGDRAYGSIWGNPLYTREGFYSDPNYVRDENSDASLGAYKWTGFFFGMGMAHQWPAVRQGGVAPAFVRAISLDVNNSLSAKARISVIAPSGKLTVYSCGSTPKCEVRVDDRQGAHWYYIDYFDDAGKVLQRSKPELIRTRPGPSVAGLTTRLR